MVSADNMSDDTARAQALLRFVARWAEVGRALGLPKGAAEVHGLLLAADAPMTAEGIAAALSIARSNVSTSLRVLRDIGLVRPAPTPERAERFEALPDPAEAAERLAAWQKARITDPAAEALRAATAELGASGSLGAYARAAEELAARPLSSLIAADGGKSPKPTKKKKKKKREG